jgi:hypothetical protein
VARWLAKGPPRTTVVQEGLAALVEVITLRSHPRRARRLNDRVIAIDKAEDGADFLEVFEWHRTEGYDEEECYNAARRVFRGGTVTGGAPFTKDIAYTKGLVTNYHFIRAAIRACRPELVRYLFVGKVAHEDVPVLHTRGATAWCARRGFSRRCFATSTGSRSGWRIRASSRRWASRRWTTTTSRCSARRDAQRAGVARRVSKTAW